MPVKSLHIPTGGWAGKVETEHFLFKGRFFTISELRDIGQGNWCGGFNDFYDVIEQVHLSAFLVFKFRCTAEQSFFHDGQ